MGYAKKCPGSCIKLHESHQHMVGSSGNELGQSKRCQPLNVLQYLEGLVSTVTLRVEDTRKPKKNLQAGP